MEHLFDAIGLCGTTLIVGTYALSQAGRMSTNRALYPVLNALGAALLLVSLSVDFNLAATVIEGFWLVISVFGVFRNLANSGAN